MGHTSLLILILILGQISGLHTLDFPENVEYADRYREYGGRMERPPPRRRPWLIPTRATTKLTTNEAITTETPIDPRKPFTTKTPVTRKPHTTTKTPTTTTSTPHMIRLTTKLTTNTPTRLPRIRVPPWLIPTRKTTIVNANESITTETPITTRKPRTTTKTLSTSTLIPHTTTLTPTIKLTTPKTPRPLSLDITGARLKYVRETKGHKVFKHIFHENEEIRLKCTFQTQRTPHVLKLMNEFGQGSQMNSDHLYINVASVSYTFRINSKSKYIYCIAMDTAGRTLLATVDLEYVAPTSDSDCRSDEHLQPGKLVVIKDELPPLLWTIGLVFQVFPAVDNSSISVARVLTGRGGGVPIIKPFTDLCPLND